MSFNKNKKSKKNNNLTLNIIKGRGGMGSRKHGKSGKSTKSPKLRIYERLLAEGKIKL